MSALDIPSLENLQSIIGGDPVDFADLATTFIAESDELVVSMQDVLNSNDASALGRYAHSMKSSAVDFGALVLSAKCADLEADCKIAWPQDAPLRVSAIAQHWQQARSELYAFMSEP